MFRHRGSAAYSSPSRSKGTTFGASGDSVLGGWSGALAAGHGLDGLKVPNNGSAFVSGGRG